jgi:hypothetical protein
MPPKVQQVKQIVDSEVDKDLLGTKASRWNDSVALPRSNRPEDMGGDFNKDLAISHRNFLIRHGFKDETITRSDPQTTYAGCDTRDVYYHGWDVSYETTPPRDKERQYQIERAFLLDKTARNAERIISNCEGVEKTVYGVQISQYTTPEEISNKINQKLRKEKDEEQELWEKLLAKAKHELPGASTNKLHARVYKQICDIKHGKKEEKDPEMTFKPNLTMSKLSKAPTPVKPKRGFRPVKTSTTQNNSGGKS